MIRGIGIDMVDIEELASLVKENSAFFDKTFTLAEKKMYEKHPLPLEYLATRFAAKEAVYKALAQLLKDKDFDFRGVETLNRLDGSPYVNETDFLKGIMQEADVSQLYISITTEGNYACAYVIAEKC